MIGIDGTEFSQKKIWDTGFAVRVSRDTHDTLDSCKEYNNKRRGKQWQDKIFSQEIRDTRFLVMTYYNNNKNLLMKQLRHVI